MYLHRNDLQKMLSILEKFPDVETFEIKQDNSSGIGSHTTMIYEINANGVSGSFEVVISSVENW